MLTPPTLDQGDEVGVELGRADVRDRGSVRQAGLTELVEPGLPLRQALSGDTGFGREVRDGTLLAAAYQAQPAGRGQRGVSVDLPLHHTPTGVTNVMSHNT